MNYPNQYPQPVPYTAPQPVSEDGKLAALVRDMLGAKGAHDIMRGLLDSVTPERRAQLVEQIVDVHKFDVELRQAFAAEMAVEMAAIVKESSARIVAALQAKQEAIVESVTKSMTEEVERSIKVAVTDKLRSSRW